MEKRLKVWKWWNSIFFLIAKYTVYNKPIHTKDNGQSSAKAAKEEIDLHNLGIFVNNTVTTIQANKLSLILVFMYTLSNVKIDYV